MALLDKLRRVVKTNRKRLQRVGQAGARRIVKASKDAERELVERLRDIAPRQFRDLEVGQILGPVTSTIERAGSAFGLDMSEIVRSLGLESSGLGRADIRDQLGVWSSENPFAGVAADRIAGELLDPGLVEYYRTNPTRYGLQSTLRMRDQLAQSALAGETLSQATDRVADAVGLESWQARRTAQTEASAAFHRRWLRDAEQGLGPEADEWRKQLIAIWDSRTGSDSKFVDGQQRRLDKPFEDNFGRIYMMPPNRPNDRETVILVERE